MAKGSSKPTGGTKARTAAQALNQAPPTEQSAAPTAAPEPILDNNGRVVRLGDMQQWVVDCLRKGDQTSKDIATIMGEDESRTITRLRQLVTKGVVILQPDRRWSLTAGPATPREPLPRLNRR